MTVSLHTYSAVLIGSPDQPLAVRGGSLVLDESRAPHVQGTVEIAVPALAVLTALDPRQNKRVRIVATATSAMFADQSRTFNLSLRGRGKPNESGTVTLTLASDESILDNYSPLTDDKTPLNYQASLRGLIGYVLNKAVPGATLAAGSDVAVPALAASENLIRNPRFVGGWDWQASWSSGGLSTGGYTTGGPAYAPSYWYMGATGGATTGAYHYITETQSSIGGDQDYVLSVDLRFDAGIQVRVDAVLFDGSGNVVGYATPVTVPGVSGTWQRKVVTFYAPPTAVRVRPRVLVVGTLAANKYIDITAWRLSRDTGDPTDTTYYDGGTAATAMYAYSWASDGHASNSVRRPLQDAATPEALTLKTGQSALDFIVSLAQRFGRRPVCDEGRVWTLRDENYTAAGSLDIRHGINLIDGDDQIDRDIDTWFDAAVTIYTWMDAEGRQRTASDAYALTPSYTRLRTFERAAAYPGPGFSQYAVRRAQGRGREVSATLVADWRAAVEQPVSIVMEGAPIQTGQTSRVEFDLDRDEMTVTTRTTDTPATAWVLLPTGQKWIDSPTGQSWTGETI